MATTVTADGKARVLADGNRIPLLGLGVWQIPDGPECVNAVRWALELGYRHIDTAQAYGNEESVGQALRESGVPRDEVFVTTKFYPGRERPGRGARAQPRRLGLDHVDLYIVHWPEGGPTWAWPGLERAHALGSRARSASRTSACRLERADRDRQHAAGRRPGAVQPVESATAARRVRARAAVVLEAYSPLGHRPPPRRRRSARMRAGRAHAGAGALRWCVERDLPVIPKSTHRERIAENAQLFDFTLGRLAPLDALDGTGRHGTRLEGNLEEFSATRTVDLLAESVPLDPVGEIAQQSS